MKILSWKEYFLGLAKITSLRSKDPNTKVGAIIVNENKRVVGLGYNGMPLGNDRDFPWINDGKHSGTKYPYVVHAEMNAIINANVSLKEHNLFVNLFPCSNCAKFIVQTGIKKIYFSDDKYSKTEDYQIAKRIFKLSNVEIEKINDFNIKIEKN